ncbi:uncharacterized protein B0P05DRAFT_587490 [Gilbertella persicaria]|uniref:Uncharacterized protein n=1 Tax=Rhizopus stolonifer TaxID=4846 RepID=A0A367KPY8_RHIST|nr:uncharacterized protein B0P05DRAFT_587490 [Gilbertella persicaria]KAI8078267.1 hypothetical protein B0P05DRAFT_587490 [Gilbertella persicaria]RCI04249.1 hypothetical protein CU098_010198 [Rhizopus stolonifer]
MNTTRSTGHGTVDVPFDQDTMESLRDNQGQTKHTPMKQHQNKQPEEKGHHVGFGHTTQHGHSPRSIKRDLNDI